jgi:hypothetical protein
MGCKNTRPYWSDPSSFSSLPLILSGLITASTPSHKWEASPASLPCHPHLLQCPSTASCLPFLSTPQKPSPSLCPAHSVPIACGTWKGREPPKAEVIKWGFLSDSTKWGSSIRQGSFLRVEVKFQIGISLKDVTLTPPSDWRFLQDTGHTFFLRQRLLKDQKTMAPQCSQGTRAIFYHHTGPSREQSHAFFIRNGAPRRHRSYLPSPQQFLEQTSAQSKTWRWAPSRAELGGVLPTSAPAEVACLEL